MTVRGFLTLLVCASALASLAAIGPQSTQVMLLKFPDRSEEPCTAPFMADVIFNQLNSWIQTESHGLASYPGSIANVWGWMDLPHPSTFYCTPCGSTLCDCNVQQIRTDAMALSVGKFVWADQDWVALIANVFLGQSLAIGDCYTATCYEPEVPTNKRINLQIAVHEGAGHCGGGLAHAGQLYWADGRDIGSRYDEVHILDDGGTWVQYGSNVDPMGEVREDLDAEWAKVHFSMPYMRRLGWKQASNLLTLTASDTVTLTDMRIASSAVQEVRIPLPSVGDGYTYAYSIEYRPDVGVLINRNQDKDISNVHGVQTINGQTWPPIITAANPFSDQYRHIVVRLISSNPTTATISVVMPGMCGR